MEEIDIVITWVDGSDPIWLAEKERYHPMYSVEIQNGDANSDCRYRSNQDLLRYWFRLIEKNAPWVRKIHFITCGQKPVWLKEDHPKISLVYHNDYIPKEYLPTFNSNVIELNLHRLQDLSECFLLFNDDHFLLQYVDPCFFFKDGCPVLITDLRYPRNVGYNNWSRIVFNNYCILQKSFNMRSAIGVNFRKWFKFSELGYKRARQNISCYLVNKSLPAHIYGHLIQPQLKSTLQEVWERWPDILSEVCSCRFRTDGQVNQWLLCGWNQAKGLFYPAHERTRGAYFSISPQNISEVERIIRNQSEPQICINDSFHNTDSVGVQKRLVSVFASILPSKSSFEND